MFESLLVANRGEIACRIIRTARAMGLRTVAVYSDPDAHAPHVLAADDAVALRGAAAADTYLSIDALLQAAADTAAAAVHPGYGFLAENAAFARACTDAGLVFVGPAPDVIATMGDKVAAKRLMREIDVPLAPGAELDGDTDLAAAGAAVGFPLLVKAAAGGGGKGMRLVEVPQQLEDAVAAARREAHGAFGDDRVFLERFVVNPRHVEVQIFGDTAGNVVHLGERECSVQRRHQKVIEESPSPALDDDLRSRMTEAAVRAARALQYTNAGTVEFVVDAARDFFFLEVNTRLQVEHPVTELAWGLRSGERLDLVRLQLLVAAGEPLRFRQSDVVPRGHAVEARVYAEDAANGFLPATGTLRAWDIPAVAGTRVDAGVAAGNEIGVHYDPMLAKVIAAAPTRAEAVNLLAATLARSRIHGVTTNRDFLVNVLRLPAFASGSYDTGLVSGGLDLPEADPHTVAVHAVAAALVQARAGHRGAPLPTLPPGWRNNRSAPHQAQYRVAGDVVSVSYEPLRDGAWRVGVADEQWTVRVLTWPDETDGIVDLEMEARRVRAHVAVAGEHVDVDSASGSTSLLRVPRFPTTSAEDVAGGLLAPMPGAVVSVSVAAGAEVTKGDLLVVLEAMKMEHRVTAPHGGTVTQVMVAPGDPVATDDVLVVLEASEG